MKRTASEFRPLPGLMFLRTTATAEPIISRGNLRITVRRNLSPNLLTECSLAGFF